MKNEFVREDANKYELMVIVNPDIGQEEIDKQLGEIKEMLIFSKGEKPEIFFEDIWGLRDLAYRIKKHERGFYAVYDFLMDPSLVQELDTNLKLETSVLRHMIVKLPFTYEAKTLAVMDKEQEAYELANPRKGRKKPEEAVKKEAVKPAPAEVKVAEKAAEKVGAAESAVEQKEEKEEKPKKTVAKKEPKATTLEDVDAKLKSIIDNPDINF
jgi:small subunit ribosomal protein S6